MSSTDDACPPPPSETLEPHSRVDSSGVNLDTNEENPPSTNLQDPELMSSDALARAISSTLGSLIKEFDSKAENTTKSQDQLSSAIDRLTGELDQLLEDAPLPFIMQHASKISGVRKRVSSLNFLLKSIQRRIDNIDRIMSTGLSHEKAISGKAGCQQP